MGAAAARLAEELCDLRRTAGKSLKELERATATSDSSLSRYFAGTAVPPWSVVEALCRTGERSPQELRELWEEARRERLSRYDRAEARAEPPADTRAEPPSDTRAELPSDGRQADAVPPPPTGSEAPPPHSTAPADRAAPAGDPHGSMGPPRGVASRPSVRRLVLWSGVVVVAAAAVVGAAVLRDRPDAVRLCPWRYVVTDGDPAPVLLSDKPGEGRRVIDRTYAPDEVFLVTEPPEVVNGHMRTVDGWVSVGDWIQRAPGQCVQQVPARR
ncbi:helix-turn-helix domain-containing protein [Cellulomonas sp. URHB0016]